MATTGRSRKRRHAAYLIQKPQGQLTERVQTVGPERFGILSFDCAKARSKYMLANFYGTVLLPPTTVAHDRHTLQATVEQVRRTAAQQGLADLVVAIERTGEYHRPVQRACRQAGWDTRLVHPYTSKQFRQPADPGNKTDDTDLAAIFRAAVNGFGLIEPVLSDESQQLQLLERHRRDLVHKTSKLCCQIREHLHALMPGYAEVFDDLWTSPVAMPLARQTGSAAAIAQAGLPGLQKQVAQAKRHCRQTTLAKMLAWAEAAPSAHPQTTLLRQMLDTLDEDRLSKTRQITALETQCAALLVRTPYLLLLAIPGINVVSAADLAGELGPISNYVDANRITGRAGLVPVRYQSDRVDHAHGPLRRRAHRRLRAALIQIADNLAACNHYFFGENARYRAAGKDPRWIRVKIAKRFSRLAFAMVAGRQLFRHPCCRQRHAILDKLLTFHREHDTPMTQVLADLQAAVEQLPRSARDTEAKPLAERLQEGQRRRRGPQPLADIIPLVLARLGAVAVQSTTSEDQDLN